MEQRSHDGSGPSRLHDYEHQIAADDIPYNDVEQNDCYNNASLDIVRDGEGQGGNGDEDKRQGVCDLGKEDLPEGWAFGPFDGIRAVPGQPGGSLFTTYAMIDMAAEILSDLVGG